MTLALYRRTRLLSLSRAGSGVVDAVEGFGARRSVKGICPLLHCSAAAQAAHLLDMQLDSSYSHVTRSDCWSRAFPTLASPEEDAHERR